MPAALALMKSILTSLAKSVLFQTGLSAGISAADAAIQNKFIIDNLIINSFK